jgi:hypothetical protein
LQKKASEGSSGKDAGGGLLGAAANDLDDETADPRLVDIVERMFKRCKKDKE